MAHRRSKRAGCVAAALLAGCSPGRELQPAGGSLSPVPPSASTVASGEDPADRAVTDQARDNEVEPPADRPETRAGLDHDRRSAWKAALAGAREKQIRTLQAYRRARRFPVFHEWGVPTPAHRILDDCFGPAPPRGPCASVFIDEAGTHCAVANLMRASGWGDAAAKAARDRIHVRIEEVTEGPVLDWILRSGLTQDEVTLVQPSYEMVRVEQRAEARKRTERLVAHFALVEKQLVSNTPVSLDIALAALEPKILAGTIRIEEVGAPPSGSATTSDSARSVSP